MEHQQQKQRTAHDLKKPLVANIFKWEKVLVHTTREVTPSGHLGILQQKSQAVTPIQAILPNDTSANIL